MATFKLSEYDDDIFIAGSDLPAVSKLKLKELN